ncbi:TetR/AcrR family transcriptional regulator [Rhizobium leguminosarum]|jgi:AcrR family transcriptional regulator|uniref:TetR/AcrR family transcriptional regulator n=2 Tax=Rhizobium TaxID=379 RepID=A0A444HXI5_RHILE|nr:MULTISPECIES: TetR/AcrR family transcriptional regulator [Rhizobium]MBY5461093.1 TetR/AcrR family transcriptional regulator [Rhizobium leguminosarum]NKL65864.1 TetR family transcriptional regulator [Rhizobium leguminosarum bv. viciae]RWX09498.1 TetR/AcrR family transcriptional regulator [Rhizobium leguminosarum]RWX28730.1 TetR/AcrR family transcriptional regulator [Rhizobium leguminosarum]TAU54948.1 TetR/AcrR family transcriptional regulator [Rhizobium leguminosarum]
MDQALNDTGWRGSQEGWLEAAYHSLLDSGVDSVKILPLAKRLNLSRTSFYWFFKDREELLAGLVARWRDKNTGNIIKQSEAYAESLAEAMLNVFDCWLNNDLFDARFEFAVRSWALQSDEILAEVRQADQLRLDALKRMFIRFGLPEATSDVRARTTYLVQIGYISMQAREELAVRMKRIPEYIAIYTGEVPQQRELDRFFSRHGYRPG